ncbi:MAG: tripartite tricarboxylate transporter TctB family protein [Candidatus Poribacteria bacterium]|nr:tripartite tricarboxylate transporter TctB family protein [Candidatus Poribacteria bacterium]
MTKNRVGALVMLTLSIAYGAMALNLPQAPGMEASGVTPASLPIALSVFGIVIAVLVFILPGRSGGDDSVIATFKGLRWRRIGYLFLLMTGYGLAIKPFGFFMSTTLFLGGGFRIMGERRLKMILPISIAVTVVFWFALTRLLSVYLEPGVLRFLESN